MVATPPAGDRLPRALRRRLRLRALGATCALAVASAASAAGLPPANQCPALGGVPAQALAEDATPFRIREGMVLAYEDVLLLGELLPVEVWRNRDAFFYDGMQLEIGPCHRRYPLPAFFEEATRRFAGSARVDAEGNLHGHVAGLPFPPEQIDPGAEDAGIRWAWNFERRYRGAGPAGRFRLVDMPSRVGGVQTYEGDWFFLQTGHRADLEGSDYRLPAADESAWITGGRFQEPFSARHLAWRQLRPLAVDLGFSKPDDTFVYVPSMRKVRRAASAWVDGVYVPRYRVAGDSGGGGLPIGGDMGGGGALNPAAGESIAQTEQLRRGFEGLALRPNAYAWRVLGFREVIAPINVSASGYPERIDRNFGPSGLSAGSDRWDVRFAVVLQGALKEPGRDYDLLTLWIDYQTLQPLYMMTRRRAGARLMEVGIQLHRFSGDLPSYPAWPDGGKANVFDPVGALFFDVADGGSGWRREAYDILSLPRSAEEIERMASPGFLDRGH